MTQLLQTLFAIAHRQPRPVQWLITGALLGFAAAQTLVFGESVGKALFRFLH